jgi:hypothetical protein
LPTAEAAREAFQLLDVAATCSVDPATNRSWVIENHNDFPIAFTWRLVDDPAQSGAGTVPANSLITLTVNTVPASTTRLRTSHYDETVQETDSISADCPLARGVGQSDSTSLKVSKTADATCVGATVTVTGTIRVENTGNLATRGLSIVDSVYYKGAGGPWTEIASSRTPVAAGGELSVGQTRTIPYSVNFTVVPDASRYRNVIHASIDNYDDHWSSPEHNQGASHTFEATDRFDPPSCLAPPQTPTSASTPTATAPATETTTPPAAESTPTAMETPLPLDIRPPRGQSSLTTCVLSRTGRVASPLGSVTRTPRTPSPGRSGPTTSSPRRPRIEANRPPFLRA